MKNVTIKDVAKYASVSPSTVSRVISNSPRISPETQERVRKAMKDLGYHPNAIARSLVTQRANTIGLVLARPTQAAFANPFFPGIIQGIAAVAQKEHFSLMLSAAKDYREEREETLKMLNNSRVDGVVLMASRVNDELIQELLDREFPFVLIGRSLELNNIPYINNDNIRAAYEVVEFLVERGCQRIAIISGPQEYVVSQDRVKGYRMALEAKGIEPLEELISFADFTYEGGFQEALKLLPKGIDAIFATDDLMALGALRAAQSLNITVPEDLSLVGFNDDPMVSYIKPALTTVQIPIVQMGEEAAKMLIRMITDKEYQGEAKLIPTRIIVRESTPG